MTEWEKAQKGYLYDANYDPDIIDKRTRCADLCYEYNMCKPSDMNKQQIILHRLLGKIKGNIVVTSPFYCDYGINISVGENFYTNHNVTEYDYDKTFGTYHTSAQVAEFLLKLYDSDKAVGVVNRENFIFELKEPQFDYAGNSNHNQNIEK